MHHCRCGEWVETWDVSTWGPTGVAERCVKCWAKRTPAELQADIDYLNENTLHINTRHPETGKPQGLAPASVHALAEIVRILKSRNP